MSSRVLIRGAKIVAIVFSLYHLLFLTYVLERFNISILIVPHRAISLGLMIILILIVYPARKSSIRDKMPWWDWGLMAVGSISCLYVILFYQFNWIDPNLHPLTGDTREWVDVTLSMIAILLVLEVTRRVMGIVLPVVALSFIFYDLFCNYFPGSLQGRGYSLMRVSEHIYLWTEGIWGVAMGVASVTVVCYVILGAFLSEFGAGDFFSDSALSLFGRVRGGPAKVSVMSSAFFGMISGSTTANVMIDGVITIPMMKRVGYSPDFSGAVEAVTSNGGQIMPPIMGAVAFLICEFLQIPYREVVLGAIIPAFLYFFICFMTVDIEAVNKGIRGLSAAELPSFWKVLEKGWTYLIPIGALLVFLLWFGYEPEISALYSLGILVLVEWPKKGLRAGWMKIIKALEQGAKGMALVSGACACAGIIIGSMTLTGLGAKLSNLLLEASQGYLFLLLIFSAFACFILGMGMTSIPIYLVVAITIGPVLIEFGIPPLAAHFFVFWAALTSFITPPVAIAAYAAAGISGGNPMKTGFQAVRLGLGTFIIPFMFIYHPALVLNGTFWEIIFSTITCIIASISLVGAVNGRLIGKMSNWERFLCGAGGFMLIVPNRWYLILGLVFILLAFIKQAHTRKTKQEDRLPRMAY